MCWDVPKANVSSQPFENVDQTLSNNQPRKPGHVTDFANLVGVTQPTKLIHVIQRMIQIPRKKSRVKKKRTFSMYEGLTTIREAHAKLRRKRGIAVMSLPRLPSLSLTQLSESSLSGSGSGKGETRPKGGCVQQKKLVTRCFDCNRFGHWSGDPICPAKDEQMRRHMSRVVLWRKQCTVHVYPESFVTSSISVEQELRGAGACDICCNRTVAGQEWMNDYVHSLKKLKLKYWTLPCEERYKFGAGDPVVCKTAYFIPVLIHGACATCVVPGKLMLLIGKDTLKVLEARFNLKNNIGNFPSDGDFEGKVLRESLAVHLLVPLLPESCVIFMIRLCHQTPREPWFS